MKEYAPKSTNEAYWLRMPQTSRTQMRCFVGLKKPIPPDMTAVAVRLSDMRRVHEVQQIQEKEMGYTGPHCVMRMIDIGVAFICRKNSKAC